MDEVGGIILLQVDVLLDDLFQQSVPLVEVSLNLPAHEPEEHLRQWPPRDEVLKVESHEKVDVGLGHLSEERVAAFLPVGCSQHRTAYDVVGVGRQKLAHVHRRGWSVGCRLTNLVDDEAHLQ